MEQVLSQSKPILKIDWCSYEAAKYAVEHWHYSRTMPAGKSVKIGAWENNKFVGCVIFSRGATPEIGMPYGLSQIQVCELTRVALFQHLAPTTKIIAIAIKLLRSQNPNLCLIVSYADKNQEHYGTIYQAGNWIYVGMAHDKQGSLMIDGRKIHGRSVFSKYGTRSPMKLRHAGIDAKYAETQGKYKYLYPLNSGMAGCIKSLRRSYPKRATSETIDTLGHQPREGGEAPTVALQSNAPSPNDAARFPPSAR